MMKAAASTIGNPAGSGMHRAAGAMVWLPKPPVPLRQATAWPTLMWVTPSPTACTMPAYSEPGTKGRAGFIWYLFCTISRSGKFRLAALISISTSPALGVGVGSSVQVRASTPTGFSHSQACIASVSKKCGAIIDVRALAAPGQSVSGVTPARCAHLQLPLTSSPYENPHFQRRRLPGARPAGPV